jgi:hypothetical protein
MNDETKVDPSTTPDEQNDVDPSTTQPDWSTDVPEEQPSKEDVKINPMDKSWLEDIKIPKSRLDKEIYKRKSAENQISKLEAKLAEERNRYSSLNEDEREELESLRKKWIETRESKIVDKLEDTKSILEEQNGIIKDLEEQIQSKEDVVFSNRIKELTKLLDWSNWRPKFDIKELEEFWRQKNFWPSDPYDLYEYKYWKELYSMNNDWWQKEVKAPVMDKWNNEWKKVENKKVSFDFDDDGFNKEAEKILAWIK